MKGIHAFAGLAKAGRGLFPSGGDFLDWVITGWLGFVLFYTFWHLGGHYPEAEAVESSLVALLLLLHGIGMAARRERPYRLHASCFLFAPFLIYAWLSCRYLSSMPWRGMEEWLVLIQGFVVFWVTAHHLRTKGRLWFIFSLLMVMGLIALYFAEKQFFHGSEKVPMEERVQVKGQQGRVWKEWLPMEKRVQVKSYQGRAWGTFGAPDNFGAYMGLLASFLFLIALMRRVPLIARALSAYLAVLFTAGLILSGSRGGWIGMVAVLLALPWFATGNATLRRIALGGGIVLFGITASLVYFNVEMVRVRVNRAIEEKGERTRKWMWAAGWRIFMDHPLLGTGIGSYELEFEKYREPEAQIGPRYAHNDYLNTLDDLGLVGFILFFGPAGYLLLRGWNYWRKLPFLAVPKNGRRREAPTAKIFLGGILLSQIGFGTHLFVDFHLKIPILLFVEALFLGCIVNLTARRRLELPNRPLIPTLWFCLCLVAGSMLAAKGTKTFMAAARYLDGSDGLKHYIRNRGELRGKRVYIEEMIDDFEDAVAWDEGHGRAWSDLSLAILQLIPEDRENRRKIGREAREKAEKALAISDQLWTAHTHYGLARLAEGQPLEVVLPSLRKAVDLSPTNPAAWVYYARALNLDPTKKKETLMAVENVLRLDPRNRYALALKSKLL